MSTRYKARGVLPNPAFPDVVLWPEVGPFLLMTNEEAVEALTEYVLWQERPSAARKGWLVRKINEALRTKASSENSPIDLVPFAVINNVRWCELLDTENRMILSREAERVFGERSGAIKPPKLATTTSPFSERLHQRLSFIGKINANSNTGEVSKYVQAAAAIWSAGPVLFNFVAEDLGVRKIKTEWFLLFNAEVACYVLHLLDRTLSTVASASSKTRIMNHLVLALCEGFHPILEEMGYKVNEAVHGFTEMYNDRQLEYGALKTGWFESVSLHFGLHAAETFKEAIEAPNDERSTALIWTARAPEIFHELLPYLPIEYDKW